MAEEMIDAHVRPCREKEPGSGGMVGMSMHLRRDGFNDRFVVHDGEANQGFTTLAKPNPCLG